MHSPEPESEMKGSSNVRVDVGRLEGEDAGRCEEGRYVSQLNNIVVVALVCPSSKYEFLTWKKARLEDLIAKQKAFAAAYSSSMSTVTRLQIFNKFRGVLLCNYRFGNIHIMQYADPKKLTGFSRENLSILGPHTVDRITIA